MSTLEEVSNLKDNEVNRLTYASGRELEELISEKPHFNIRYNVKFFHRAIGANMSLLIYGRDVEDFTSVLQHWDSHFNEWRTAWNYGYPELAEKLAHYVNFTL